MHSFRFQVLGFIGFTQCECPLTARHNPPLAMFGTDTDSAIAGGWAEGGRWLCVCETASVVNLKPPHYHYPPQSPSSIHTHTRAHTDHRWLQIHLQTLLSHVASANTNMFKLQVINNVKLNPVSIDKNLYILAVSPHLMNKL